MAEGRRSTGPGGLSAESVLVFVCVGLFGAVVTSIWSSLGIAAAIDNSTPVNGNPIGALTDLIAGTIHWSDSATKALLLQLLLLALLGVLGFSGIRRLRDPATRVDRSALLMSKRQDLRKLTREGARQIADRLGAAHAGPGVLIGRTVRGNLEIFGSWEDLHVDIWGPRAGKTTSRAVPAILDAPGAVIATSNKRDLV
ncbi:MAG TPA: conjugal transfer protein, partial [Kribbella sp.]